jgi:hypothetical protein
MQREKWPLGLWIGWLTFLLLFGLMAVGGIIGITKLIKYFLGWVG